MQNAWEVQSTSEDVTTIPEEHRHLAGQIDAIRRAVRNTPVDMIEVIGALQQLLETARAHFHHEETMMSQYEFPDIVIHVRDHNYLIKSLSDYTASLVDNTITLTPEIGDNLNSWLVYHIKKYDDAYQQFKALA